MSALSEQAAGRRTHRSRTRVKPTPAAVQAEAPITVTGVKPDGEPLTLTLTGVTPRAVAEGLYDGGALAADLMVDGRLVGQVCRNLRGDRTWWGAKS